MSTATVSGTIVAPASPSGNNQTIPIGAPVITASSTTGAQLSFTESAVKTLSVAQGDGEISVSFDTLTDADILYIGSDQPIDVKIDGSSTAHSLEAGGFIMVYKGSASAMTVQATTANVATVTVALFGS